MGKPRRVLGWRGCGIHDVASLVANDAGVVPNVGPEQVDVGDGPLIEVLVRLEFQTVLTVDLTQESEESGRILGVIRGEQRHRRVK